MSAPSQRGTARGAFGKAPPERDPRTLQLGAYARITERLPAAPPARDWSLLRTVRNAGLIDGGPPPGRIGFEEFANKRLPNCTAAAIGHLDQVVAEHAVATPTVTEDLAIATYYRIAEDPPRSGASMLRALRRFRELELLEAFVELNARSRVHLELAVHLFGGAYVGANLPAAADTQEVWDIAPGAEGAPENVPDPRRGHAMLAVAYDQSHVTFVSWGELQRATWRWVRLCVDEAYAALHRAWVDRRSHRRSPAGYLVDAVLVDLLRMGLVR